MCVSGGGGGGGGEDHWNSAIHQERSEIFYSYSRGDHQKLTKLEKFPKAPSR